MSANPWQWSTEYQRYYRYEIRNGQNEVIWDDSGSSTTHDSGSSTTQQQLSYAQPQASNLGHQNPHGYVPSGSRQHAPSGTQDGSRWRADSVSAADPNMAQAAPVEVQPYITFRGTPERGWYETLDNRYRVRTNAEEYHFFTQGRVFAMLWSEPAGETAINSRRTDNTGYTTHPKSGIFDVRFGQKVFCQIRRFVVIRVNRRQHFVEACAITTYGNRGVLKPGCNPSEHTIVYSQGLQPYYAAGERERGMTKAPIAVAPAEPGEYMLPMSRLRFGKTYTIECNVKVRDMGMVVKEQRTALLLYYQDERDKGFEPGVADDDDDDDDDDNDNDDDDDDDDEEDDDDDDGDDDNAPQAPRLVYYNG